MRIDVRVDFIGGQPRPSAGLWLLVVAAALLVWQSQAVWQEAEALQRTRVGLVTLQRQADMPRAATMTPDDITRHDQIDLVARSLATPWDRLLGLFEEHATAPVRLLKFEPDATDGHVELSGRATSSKVLADYLIVLEHDPRLSSVMLHHHQVLRDEAGAPVEFSLGAVWSAASGPATAASVPGGSAP
jgi:Tfp pilus assembly protein PilN